MTTSPGGRREVHSHRTPRHRSKAPSRNRLRRIAALTLVFVLAFSTSAIGFAYTRLQGNIDQHDITDLLGTERPTAAEPTGPTTEDAHEGETLNFLFMGTDSRDGANAELDGSGTTGGMRADTTLLVQVPADRQSLTVVSIPRDTLVTVPECQRPDGSMTYSQSNAMFNSAFNTGSGGTSFAHGAACTIKTVEQLTGVFVDDFVVVDFQGFIHLIDALDGVPMYVEEDINSREADLELVAGCQILDGTDALGFARVRKGVGDDGSDISRIGRQQDLMMAVIRDILSSRVLTNPVRLYEVADRGTQTLTAGNTLGSIPQLVGLAASMVNLDLNEVVFVTMPFDWQGARVSPNLEYSEQLWENLRNGQPVDERISGPGWEITERLLADEAAANATDEPTDGASEPTDEPDDGPEQPTDDIAEPTDDVDDGSAVCTREVAEQ